MLRWQRKLAESLAAPRVSVKSLQQLKQLNSNDQFSAWLTMCEKWVEKYEALDDLEDWAQLEALVEEGSHLPFSLIQYRDCVEYYEKHLTLRQRESDLWQGNEPL